MHRPVRIEGEGDAEFVRMLVLKQIDREKKRSLNKVYSPSSLANCLRQVYLAKHYEELGIKRMMPTKIEPNFYFLNGEWLHMKWQYALWKMNKMLPDEEFFLWGVEIPVSSKRGDHAGTLDALFSIDGTYYIADFKGVNVRAYQSAVAGDVPHSYELQISDYGMLANVDKTLKIPKIEKALIVFENKGGPLPSSPIALHEHEVNIADHLPEIKFRIGELRQNEEENSIPNIECQSTKSIQFSDCPFRKYCKVEVADYESRNPEERSVKISTRSRTSRAGRRKP